MTDYKKPDYWQLKARQEHYPARSVYKLMEMDEKFGLLPSRQAHCVLDLGAAPGSWSLYLLRKKPSLKLLAVDLAPLSREHDGGLFDSEHFSFIQGDFTEAAVRDSIAVQGPFSLILSDAAPPTTGNRFIDSTRSYELAESVIVYGESLLAIGGSLVVKVFQGGDSAELLKRMRGMFKTARAYKPAACRGDSFETFYIGLEKK